MIRKIVPINMDIESKNNVLPRNLLQGNEDLTLNVTLTRGNVAETVTPSAKITLVCIYGLETYYDTNLKKNVETNKGNYVLAPGETDYNITIANNIVTIPVTEMITNVHGKNQLILHVEDGINAFTYNMIYYVDENLAYSAKATPNNLPTYESLKQTVDAVKAANDQNTQDIAGLKDDVNDLATDIPNKANSDLSNVQAIQAIPDGNIVHVKDGTLKDTGINVNEATNTVDFPYSIKTLPNTLYLGDNVEIHENGGFVENTVVASNRKYLMLDYLNDDALGTQRPVYWERGKLNPQVVARADSSQVMNNVTSVAYGKPIEDHETMAIYFKMVTAVNNFRFKVNVNGKDVSYYPSKAAWLGNEPGYNLTANLNRLALSPHFSSLTDYNINFEFRADGPINMLGSGSIPWIALDQKNITKYEIALKDDIGSELTPEQIRDKLSTLVDDERLDASHIKNLPTSTGVNEFVDLTDTPAAYAGNKAKILAVKDDETGLEFVDQQAAALNPEKLTFSHSLGVKAVNRTGATITAKSFVFLSPKPNGKFNMNPITKDTHYNGEMFGIVEADVADQAEETVNLITNYQTGVTGVSEGVACYVGFANDIQGDNSIIIAQEADIEQPFGRCGIFGKTNSVGEFMATFDSFQVQAEFLMRKHADRTMFHSDSLPAVIDKEAHLVFLEFDGGAGAGTVFQQLPNISDIEEGTQITVVNDSSSELKKITLQGPNLINGVQSYDINGQEKAILVAGKQEWYVVYHTKEENIDLSAKVKANTDEINRLKTDIGSGGLPVYAWRNNGVPTVPNDQAYKAYYIHSTVLRDDLGVIQIPDKAPEGSIFSVENNDRNNYLSIRPAAGQTINGQSGLYKCTHDTLNFFVRDGNNWVLAYGGVFPNNYDALKSTIQSLFPNSLHTIAEVQAQLKDRLHTFREIQNEFNDQLHTLDQIEASMTQKGFRKQGGRMGVQGDQSVPVDINSWAVRDFAANEEFLLPAQNKGQQYVLFSLPTDSASVVGEIKINNAVMEFTPHDLVDNELDYKVFISANTVDTSTTIRFKIEYQAVGTSGIEIDDGVTNKAGITKINTVGAYLSKVYDDSNEVTLNAATSWETLDGMGGGKASRVLTEFPLLTYLDPDVKPGEESRIKLYLQHGYYELSKPPGYLAYLTENEEIVGRIKPNEPGVRVGAIWFDDIIVGGNSAYIGVDKPHKALSVEDYTEDDPNVTGGIPTLIAFRVAMKGKATSDGFVEIMLKKTDEGTPTQNGDYMLDSNGQPIGLRHQYKAGDDLGVLDCMAIYMAKEQVKFQCLLEHNFADDGVMLEDRTEGASGILIQALGPNYATGDALLQFENDTMQNIEMTKHYNGEDIFNIAWALGYDQADVDINAGVGETSVSGLHFYNNTNLKVGIADKTMHIHNNNVDMAYFSLGQIFSAEKTYMLRGKDLDVKLTLQDKNSAFRVYMVKWTGLPDKYTTKVIDHYDADQGAIPETNWELAGSIFISEDPISGDHDFAGTLTVPADANNFAVVIVPIVEQIPVNLYIKGFEVNVSEPFYGWILEAPELVGEKHLQFDERHAELRCDLGSSLEVRYTLNNVPAGMPMPIGVIKSGKADIEIDHTVNQVSGSQLPQFEGAIKFNKEGKATIKTDLYVHSEKEHSVLATTSFWYSKVSLDGNTFTKIPLSEYTTQVRGQTKAINHMPKFEINVQPGDRIALFGTSDQADGAFIDTTETHVPMLKTVVTFDEITSEEQDLLDTILELDQEIVITDAAKAAGWYIELDYDPDSGKPSLSPKQRVVNP